MKIRHGMFLATGAFALVNIGLTGVLAAQVQVEPTSVTRVFWN